MHPSNSFSFHKIKFYIQRDLGADLIAGLTGATAGAPQAMAFAILAGISPIYGLYTAIISTIVASLTGSSSYMTTGPTNALAIVVGSTLIPVMNADTLPERLVTLTFLVGLFQLIVGLLRLGDMTRYVSGAVMTGFITGASLLVILGQLGHLLGVEAKQHGLILPRIADIIGQLGNTHTPTLVIGCAAMIIILVLHKTRLTYFATLSAIVLTGVAVAILDWDVLLVRDISEIPSSIPALTGPRLDMMPDLVTAAIAIGVLGLVQTAALAQSVDELDPDAHSSNTSREFLGQGLSNLVGSIFQGMPAGGSLSRTAVNMKAGAHTRLANTWAGLFVGIIMLLFGGFAEQIPLAALAGHLMVAAASLINPERIGFYWRASLNGQLVMTATFLSTLFLPLQYSVYVGVLLSLLLYIKQSSHVQITQLVPIGDNQFREVPIPDHLPNDQPIIVSVNGNLFFAAIHDLQERLPDTSDTFHPVVILRLRGDELLAGTGINVLLNYARQLQTHGGKLILCGVEEPAIETLERTGAMDNLGKENVFAASDVLFYSLHNALSYARQWLAEQK